MPGIIRRRLPLGYANIAIIYLISAELLVIMSAPCKKTRCAIGNTRLPRQFHRWIASDQSKVSGAHLRWLHCLLRAIVQLPLLASKHTYIPHSNRVVICRRFTLLHFLCATPVCGRGYALRSIRPALRRRESVRIEYPAARSAAGRTLPDFLR